MKPDGHPLSDQPDFKLPQGTGAFHVGIGVGQGLTNSAALETVNPFIERTTPIPDWRASGQTLITYDELRRRVEDYGPDAEGRTVPLPPGEWTPLEQPPLFLSPLHVAMTAYTPAGAPPEQQLLGANVFRQDAPKGATVVTPVAFRDHIAVHGFPADAFDPEVRAAQQMQLSLNAIKSLGELGHVESVADMAQNAARRLTREIAPDGTLKSAVRTSVVQRT